MAASTDQLHTHAIEAEKHMEQLATGLGQVGADPAAVKAVSKMADVMRQIASGLAKGGTADEPAPEPAPQASPSDRMGAALDDHMAAQKPQA